MNRKWKISLASLAVFSVFFLITEASSMERKGPPPGGHDPGWVLVLETAARLDLTAEQKAAILEIAGRYRNARENCRLRLRELPVPADAAAPSGQIDEEALRKHFQAVSSIREELFVLPMKMRKELAGVLTPEQAALLDRLEREGVREHPRHGGPPDRI